MLQLWFALKYLDNLLCSGFNAFEILCENTLLVRTTFLYVRATGKTDILEAIEATTTKEWFNQRSKGKVVSYRSDQSPLDSFLNYWIEILWWNFSFTYCHSIDQKHIPLFLGSCGNKTIVCENEKNRQGKAWQVEHRYMLVL